MDIKDKIAGHMFVIQDQGKRKNSAGMEMINSSYLEGKNKTKQAYLRLFTAILTARRHWKL